LVSTIDSREERTNRAAIQVRDPEVISAVADITQHEARDLYLDGVAAALKGKRTTAERLLRASLALDPQDHQAWLWLAGVVVKPEESIEHLERVLELSPNDPHALEGIQWARKKLGSQPSTGTLDVAISPSEQPNMVRSRNSSIDGPTTPANIKGLPLMWIALVLCGVLLLLVSTAVLCISIGFPQSLLQYVQGIMPEPVQTSIAIAETNTSNASPTFTIMPAPVITSKATIRLTAVPIATVEFRPPTRSLLTGQFITIATSPAVILPSPTPHTTELLSFLPSWHPAISPMAALRRSSWQRPAALWEKGPKKTQPRASIEGKRIEIDIGEQTLRAFEGDNLVMEFIVSTGPKNAPTVQGKFYILSKYRAIDMSGPGYYVPAVPYTMFFHDGYAIHGAYWHDKFGQPTGHGCVNMKTEDAKHLFEWSEPRLVQNTHVVQATANNQGTLVVIHE